MMNIAETSIPIEIFNEILKHSDFDFVTLGCVNRQLEFLTQAFARNNPRENSVGKAEWIKYGGDPGIIPPISLKMYRDFDSNLELLTLIPKTLTNKPLSLSLMKQLSSNRLFLFDDDIVDETVGEFKSHFVVLSREVLHGTRNKEFSEQQELVHQKGYEVPNLIDAVVSILMNNMITGEFLYPGSLEEGRWTYTRVLEKNKYGARIIVGGFGDNGLYVDSYEFNFDTVGTAYSKKSIG